ncbi:MAG TPA: nucleotidyl transferase AbiEii/AbiGii toxin family protein [Candidatus Dormibacteraeota bacterium]|nr:nucleotidyl transferase AbiEii/AbiGii toxin family protein [Candidatus Dormibacteraeota bacterium]
MNPSLEYLERCAAETGFQIIPLEKVVRLGEVAADVSRHPLLGEALALKGGTALNLCFGPPQRLSVDLDFNYIAHLERERMLADRPRVERAAADLARRLGYRVQQSADSFAGRKFFLTYRSVLGQDDRIELDMNYLFRLPLAVTETRSVWQPGELDRPHARVVGQTELVVGKVLALLDRFAPRDLWDVAYLPGGVAETTRTPEFRALFIALSAVLERSLTLYGRERIEGRITDRTVAPPIGRCRGPVRPRTRREGLGRRRASSESRSERKGLCRGHPAGRAATRDSLSRQSGAGREDCRPSRDSMEDAKRSDP